MLVLGIRSKRPDLKDQGEPLQDYFTYLWSPYTTKGEEYVLNI